ncbi:uncharacterized protein [Ambystoma mexicanum]|uniref:uncharacterized protein isoform X5 n=1 Tax=Ambystoma mexicanum TaxID=8296 RepID=UPI0037E7B453
MEEDKKRRRKPPLPSKESGYSLCNEAKCTGTPHCRSINSDSDISTVAEPTGLAYAQDTELHSLSATLLLLVKRKISKNLMAVVFAVLLVAMFREAFEYSKNLKLAAVMLGRGTCEGEDLHEEDT